MSLIFPPEVVALFAQTRAALLVIRCTCRTFAGLAGKYKVTVVRKVGKRTTRTDNLFTHMRPHGTQRVTCTIYAGNFQVHEASAREPGLTAQIEFAKKLAREYLLTGETPLVPFCRHEFIVNGQYVPRNATMDGNHAMVVTDDIHSSTFYLNWHIQPHGGHNLFVDFCSYADNFL